MTIKKLDALQKEKIECHEKNANMEEFVAGYRRSVLTYQEARERMDRKLLKLKELESIKVTFENGKELSKKIYQVKKSIRHLQRNSCFRISI